ncbi:hypothetical protein EMCRGX_G028682 [Ephydatia muelleri]
MMVSKPIEEGRGGWHKSAWANNIMLEVLGQGLMEVNTHLVLEVVPATVQVHDTMAPGQMAETVCSLFPFSDKGIDKPVCPGTRITCTCHVGGNSSNTCTYIGQPVKDETEWGYTEVPVPMIELVDVNADSWHQGRGTHHTPKCRNRHVCLFYYAQKLVTYVMCCRRHHSSKDV